MTHPTADFRSDTVTQPTPAMREAMAAARVGDDVMGEDPTVSELEREGALYLGVEAALYLPSGTMANQVAIHVHCRPGDELICEERAHVYCYEGGSVARLSGTQVRTFASDDGHPSVENLRSLLRADDPHYPRTRLIVLENTHNMAGGRVFAPERHREVCAWAREQGIHVHVDGARLANAAVALGCSPHQLTAGVDSVSLCLSKGLGAPVGSLVGGSVAFVRDARRVRKAFGGGMRQAGVIAAAGLLALVEGPSQLALDHERVRQLAHSFDRLPGLSVVKPETNILMVDLESEASQLVSHLAEDAVLAAAVAPRRVRFVTHRDLDDSHLARCIQSVEAWANKH